MVSFIFYTILDIPSSKITVEIKTMKITLENTRTDKPTSFKNFSNSASKSEPFTFDLRESRFFDAILERVIQSAIMNQYYTFHSTLKIKIKIK